MEQGDRSCRVIFSLQRFAVQIFYLSLQPHKKQQSFLVQWGFRPEYGAETE
jgi:hypothetical protein